MERDALDLHRDYIENQKQQIEFANNLIEHANGNEAVIRMANELIKNCEKCISIEQNMNIFMYCPECKTNFNFVYSDIIEDVWVICPTCKNKIKINNL